MIDPFKIAGPTCISFSGGRTSAYLCFLKAFNQVQTLIAQKPERAIWWARMEALALASKPSGAVFRSDRPTYAQMLENTKRQVDFIGYNEEPILCFCGD